MAFGTAPLIEDQVFQGSHQPSLRFRMHHQLFFSEKRQQKGVLDQVLCLLYAASHAVRQFKHFFILLLIKRTKKTLRRVQQDFTSLLSNLIHSLPAYW